MHLNAPRLGEIVAAASGAALIVSLFLPWYASDADGCPTAPAPCPPSEASGFEAFSVLDVVLVAAAVVGIALLLLQVTQPTAAVPVAWAAITALVGLVVTVWVAYRTLDPPAAAGSLDPRFAYLGLLASVGLATGAWLSMRDEGFGLRPGLEIEATLPDGTPPAAPDPLPVPGPGAPREGGAR